MAHTEAVEWEAWVESHKYVATAFQAQDRLRIRVDLVAVKAFALLRNHVFAALKACALLSYRVAAAPLKAWFRTRTRVYLVAVKAFALLCKTFVKFVRPWSHILVLAVFWTSKVV